MKKVLFSIFLVAIILVSFNSGLYYGKSQCEICPPEELDFSLFWQTWHELQEKFVNKSALDTQKMIFIK